MAIWYCLLSRHDRVPLHRLPTGEIVSGLGWYARRVAAMSPGEMAGRARRTGNDLVPRDGWSQQTDYRMPMLGVSRPEHGVGRGLTIDSSRSGAVLSAPSLPAVRLVSTS